MSSKAISILLVEDDPFNKDLLLTFLEEYTFSNIFLAANGQEGYESFLEHKPDIILTDLNMPVMDGLSMSEKIKQKSPNTFIILITSQMEIKITEQALDIGIDNSLFKPINLMRLHRVLNKSIERILLQRNLDNKINLLHEYKHAIDVSAAITKTDQNGFITYVNDAFCSMSGYTKEELLGANHNLVEHPDTSRDTFDDMWDTLAKQLVWKGKIKNLKKDGSTYYEYLTIVPITDQNNKIVEYIAVHQDITELYLNEENLKQKIAQQVERNIALHKKQEEANLLQTKFSTIGKMAAGITHEINTPLTYMRGNLELMIQDIDALDDSIAEKKYLREDSQTVLDGIHRIASIVESMREMASQTKEIPQTANIYACVLTALTLAYNKAKQTSEMLVQNESFSIGMDKEKFQFEATIQIQRIEQVIVIILNNALDVLKKIDNFHDRLLTINIEKSDQYILIKIQDNGGGISDTILPKIFDPFQSDKEEGGMGIGLNVAKRIMDDHGGKILPSNVNGGALFELYIPKHYKGSRCFAE